ncbi:MAG: hypothetical protein PHW65_05910 [Dehalococcoidales bacterium]|nr:hypothetical protein [Dehalococcoidales bacterium]
MINPQIDVPKLKFPPPQIIMCEHLDFGWSKRHLPEFRKDWKRGLSLEEMADKYGRRWEEVLLLIIDQLEKDAIRNRPGGIFGGKR